MYEEDIHFGKLFLKQSEMVLEHLTQVKNFTTDKDQIENKTYACYISY